MRKLRNKRKTVGNRHIPKEILYKMSRKSKLLVNFLNFFEKLTVFPKDCQKTCEQIERYSEKTPNSNSFLTATARKHESLKKIEIASSTETSPKKSFLKTPRNFPFISNKNCRFLFSFHEISHTYPQ